MEIREILLEIEMGIEEGRATREAAEAAREAAQEWATKIVRKISKTEARALGRSVGLGGRIPSSPLLPALLILAASGDPEAAEVLRRLGIPAGMVEIPAGGRGVARVATSAGKITIKFDPPAACRGAWFSWRDQVPQEPAMGSRARVKQAR